MSEDWKLWEWSLDALPFRIWQLLCDRLDNVTAMGNGYPMLADQLRIYSPPDIDLFAVRCSNRSKIPNSPTNMLLMDFADRGGTIQQVQLALENMKHVAADIIPQNLAYVYTCVNHYYCRQRQVTAYPGNTQYQNTELSICNCPTCNVSGYNGANGQSVQPTYPEGRLRSSACYQQCHVYGTTHPSMWEHIPPRRVPAPATPRQYPADISLQEETIQSGGHQIPSTQQVRSELRESADQHRRYMQSVCEHCRIQADPEETVLMTVSGDKKPQCECPRQSPIGATNSDDSSSGNQSVNSPYQNETSITSGASRRTSGQRNVRNQPDMDRHSWPSSSPEVGSRVFRNCSSDSRLSLHPGHGTVAQANQSDTCIGNTIYARIGSNSSEACNQYYNNLDTDEEEYAHGEHEHLEPNIRLSNSMNETRGRQPCCSTAPTIPSPSLDRSTQNHTRVFVTYAWNAGTDTQPFLEEVVQCCQHLKQAGAKVNIDMDESSYASLRLNKLDWIDKHMRQANYILVCITPTYLKDVEEQTQREESPRISQLNARYVFDKLRLEYFTNNAVNYRVIPVIFRNYGTTELHVPSCMRTTVIHSYPDSSNSILKAVFGRGRNRPT